jgi:hypothetical protein
MICTSCKSYYRRSAWNPSKYCEKCFDETKDADDEYSLASDDDSVEIDSILNPTGKTQPKFYD